MSVREFMTGSVRLVLRGPPIYYAWLAFLAVLIVSGAFAWAEQLRDGLLATNMRDPVSWGLYIGNFTVLVGIAAAAVVLVIPAYLYDWKPIKEVVLLGELLAVAAMVMCILFVLVDLGRPERFWHLVPLLGHLNFPSSLLAWDVLALTAYFLLNWFVVTYLVYKSFRGERYSPRLVHTLVFLSIPLAVGIHTVTAFLFNGLAARPFWNASILAPRFLASAFCSGPSLVLIVLMLVRRTTRLEIRDEALHKIGELLAYAMAINLFLLGAEVFKEFYSGTQHTVYIEYMFLGFGGKSGIAPFMWLSVVLNVVGFVLLLVPRFRRDLRLLATGAVTMFAGIYVEKGMGLVIPGLTPDTLGEIYEYVPSLLEYRVSAGIWSLGWLLFTLMAKVAIPTSLGEFRHRPAEPPGGDAEA